MFNKNKTIRFVSVVDGLSSIEECVPKNISNNMPKWWHELPIKRSLHKLKKIDAGNVKNCPGIKDYLSQGYILPMWTDIILYYNSDTQEWAYRVSDSRFKISTHSNEQYVDDVNHKFYNKDTHFIFKFESPWKIFTPNGYSVYQLPVLYHFNEDFSIAAGIRDTDNYHQLNLQVLIHSDKKEIFIPRGTPLAHFIPFKREKMDLDFYDATENDIKEINSNELNFSTKFPGSKLYFKNKSNNKKDLI